jgi:BetR domain
METLVMDARRQVAEEVRAYLARKRMSVREAARRLGLGQTAMHRRVVGEIPFDVGEIVAIAELLDVPVERFFATASEGASAGGSRNLIYLNRRAVQLAA